MWSIYHQPQLAFAVRQRPQLKQHGRLRFRRDQVFRSPSMFADGQRPIITSNHSMPLRVELRLKASVVPPSESGDVTTFLGVSGGLIFIYWIFNFVVPDLISKYFQFDKVNQERDSDNKP